MAGIDRTTIITGPALVQFGGSSFWSKGDVLLKPVFKRFGIETAHAGKVDERFSDRRYEVTFEPAGQFTDAIREILWPHQTPVVGTSLFGATDSPLVVWGQDGLKVTINNAAVTQMPNIRFGVDKTTIGPVKFTGLLAKSTDPTNAAAYYTLATASHPGHAGFDIGEIWTVPPVAAWGPSTPWNLFHSESGWEVSFAMKLAEQAVDGFGTVDITLQGLDISAKAIPVGPTVAQVLTALQASAALGTSLSSEDTLYINESGSPGSPTLSIPTAALVDAGDFGYGATRKRLGTCEWISTANGGFTIAEVP